MKGRLLIILLMSHLLSTGQSRNLDFFIRKAENNSALIKDYQNQVLANHIDSLLLRAANRPGLSFVNTDSYAPVINGWGYDPAISNIANIISVLQANKNFISRGNLSAQLRTINLQRRSLLDTIQLSAKELYRTITDQYITAYADQLALEFTKEVFSLMKKEELLLKDLTRTNVIKQTDYLNFYVTMQQQELNYLQAEMQYKADYLTLNYLTGIPDTTVYLLENPAFPDMHPIAEYNSILYKTFITDSLRLANEKELIRYQYQPRLGTFADAGYTSALQSNAGKNFGWSFGASLIVPIYDGHQKKLKYSQIELRERTRQSNKTFFMTQYRLQTQLLMKQLQESRSMVQKINTQIEYAHALVTASNKLLESGDMAVRDYLTAINNYLGAKNTLTLNVINQLRIMNQLNYWNK